LKKKNSHYLFASRKFIEGAGTIIVLNESIKKNLILSRKRIKGIV